MALRRLCLVADDYAISPAVSTGIRDLAALGRLSATGVMTVMPHWPAEAAALRVLRGDVAIGLHFTLTDQSPLGEMKQLAPNGRLPGISQLLRRSLAGRLPHQEIVDEFERQLRCFETYFGAAPDFIDGHQHVHLLPGIWPIVQAAFAQRLDRQQCWLRDCYDRRLWRRGSLGKAGLISRLGRAASRAARSGGIRTNRGFSGFYNYTAGSLSQFFAPMLRGAEDGHAMMVHPGHIDDALRAVDSLIEPREAEFAFLAGDAFPEQLTMSGFRLAKRDEIGA